MDAFTIVTADLLANIIEKDIPGRASDAATGDLTTMVPVDTEHDGDATTKSMSVVG